MFISFRHRMCTSIKLIQAHLVKRSSNKKNLFWECSKTVCHTHICIRIWWNTPLYSICLQLSSSSNTKDFHHPTALIIILFQIYHRNLNNTNEITMTSRILVLRTLGSLLRSSPSSFNHLKRINVNYLSTTQVKLSGKWENVWLEFRFSIGYST